MWQKCLVKYTMAECTVSHPNCRHLRSQTVDVRSTDIDSLGSYVSEVLRGGFSFQCHAFRFILSYHTSIPDQEKKYNLNLKKSELKYGKLSWCLSCASTK